MQDLAALQKKAREAGRPLLGCFPPYPPLELFTALGLTPLVLWNLGPWQRDTAQADGHVQPFACSVARRLAQACLGPEAAGFDALFMYNACDTLRNLPEVIEQANPDLTIHRMHLPQTHPPREHARAYLEGEIRDLAVRLAAGFGTPFSRDAFGDAVERHGRLRALALEAAGLAARGLLPFSRYAGAMNRVWLSSLEDGEGLLKELIARAARTPAPARARVVLSGIQPPPGPILDLMEEGGIRVVADDIASLSRALTPGPATPGDLGAYWWAWYMGHHPCPTLLYSVERRMGLLPDLARRSGAEGVIFVGEKFCECEYFEFPLLTREIQGAGFPAMVLELAIDDRDNLEAFRTRLEAFAEAIESGKGRPS